MKLGDAHIAAMPGVPSEMFAMFTNQILPKVQALGLGGGVLVQRKINTFGMGESGVEEQLLDLTKRGHVPEVGITVSDAVISLRILAHAATPADAQALIAPVERTIRERLGDLVFGVEDEELHDAVAALLAAKRKTIVTAESITCGLVAHSLAHVPGISDWLRGGIIAYTNEMKTQLLGVPKPLLDEKGAVSPEVAEAMAIGARQRLGTDLAVSTTGYAGPSAGGPDKPAGLVYVGLAWDGGAAAYQFNWSGTRLEVQRRTAKLALNRVRLHLLRGAQV